MGNDCFNRTQCERDRCIEANTHAHTHTHIRIFYGHFSVYTDEWHHSVPFHSIVFCCVDRVVKLVIFIHRTKHSHYMHKFTHSFWHCHFINWRFWVFCAWQEWCIDGGGGCMWSDSGWLGHVCAIAVHQMINQIVPYIHVVIYDDKCV